MPTISVVLVVHQAYQKYLPTALKSLQNQSSSKFEVIVVDNTGRKLSVGANEGIRKAKGRYIVRVDADDWIEPELLQLESQYLDEHDVDCVWCDYLKTTPTDHKSVFHVEHYTQPVLEHACGAMFKKSVWEELNGYDETLDFQEAYDFWCRFRRAGFKADHLEIPLYYYFQHTGSMSTSPERLRVRKQLENKYANGTNSII